MDPGRGGVCGQGETGEWLSGLCSTRNSPGGRWQAHWNPQPLPRRGWPLPGTHCHVQHVLVCLLCPEGGAPGSAPRRCDTAIVLAVCMAPHCACRAPGPCHFLAAGHSCQATPRNCPRQGPSAPPTEGTPSHPGQSQSRLFTKLHPLSTAAASSPLNTPLSKPGPQPMSRSFTPRPLI